MNEFIIHPSELSSEIKGSSMRIYVCPVSGGAFPIQLGLLSECGLIGNRPDIVMGSSGGNVASYIGLAANWQADAIPSMALKINSSMFVQSWWPTGLRFLPSWWIGYWKGSVYASGTGSLDLFKTSFTDTSIINTEVWTGTMNRETGKGQLFCNRSEKDSQIKRKEDDLLSSFRMRDCMPLTYLDGNIGSIASITMASAAIPVLVPEQQVLGARYVDGGTLFSSPLTALQDRILDLAFDEQPSGAGSRFSREKIDPEAGVEAQPSGAGSQFSREKIDPEAGVEAQPSGATGLHIDYFSSFDMQATSSSTCRSLYDNGAITIGEMVKSLCVQDRLVALELLRDGKGSSIHFASLEGSANNLRIIENVRKSLGPTARTVLELCPVKNDSIDLLNFQATDITRLIEDARKNYQLRFWWCGSLDDSIRNLIPTAKTVK